MYGALSFIFTRGGNAHIFSVESGFWPYMLWSTGYTPLLKGLQVGWLKLGSTVGRRTSTNQIKAPKRCFGHMEGVGGDPLPSDYSREGGGALDSSLQAAEPKKSIG